jgi:quaternary ammonium compound-resistance protein SugE
MIAWMFLFLAVILEICWASTLKFSQGYTKLWPSVLSIVLTLLTSVVLSQAFRTIPAATGYAIWTGLGAIGVAICAVFLFGESFSVAKALCMMLIFSGVIGLRLVGNA